MIKKIIDRILIIGLGSIGTRHLRLVREIMPHADIRVMRHTLTNEVPEYANGCFFNIEDATAFLPQIAVIASPAPFHITAARALAKEGVHLLIEKPLSNTSSGILPLINLSKERGIVVAIGYNLRFLQSLRHFRQLLNKGIIGGVLSVRCDSGQYLPMWRPSIDYRQTASAQHALGGGVLLELSHELDYLRWIFGDIEWVKATLSRQSSLEIDVEDTAHLTLGFLSESKNHQVVATVNLDFVRHDHVRSCIAIGESGSLRWNGITGTVELFEMGSTCWRELSKHMGSQDESYIQEWKEFIMSIQDCKNPMVGINDGLKVVEIIEAARHSASFGGIRVYVADQKNIFSAL